MSSYNRSILQNSASIGSLKMYCECFQCLDTICTYTYSGWPIYTLCHSVVLYKYHTCHLLTCSLYHPCSKYLCKRFNEIIQSFLATSPPPPGKRLATGLLIYPTNAQPTPVVRPSCDLAQQRSQEKVRIIQAGAWFFRVVCNIKPL